MGNEAANSQLGAWLPEDRLLKLTAIELGALAALLLELKNQGRGQFPIMKPGPDGQRVVTTLIDRLLEKVFQEANRK
jgi:hypothetical protein